jgi:Lrp/AsnC family leucine-responsive transcriptional regulator
MQKDPLKEQTEYTVLPLDEKDKAILRYIQSNAKATVREIATNVHLSTTPVHERIKRMED